MKKRNYTVKTKFVFEGEFYITAESKAQAMEYVLKHCGMVMGGDVHTSLPSEICNWSFNIHPKKIVK